MSEVAPGVRRSMRGNRSRDTKPELAVRSVLHSRGLRFRVQFRPLADRRYTADLVFTRVKIAVFIDGCWWHGCPVHYREPKSNRAYWVPKIERNMARDKLVNRLLAEHGWLVIRAWEHDDASNIADEVELAVSQRRARNPRPYS